MVHFVLIHGVGGGAYFWFRFANLLQESGHKVSALDLAAAGATETNHADVKSFHDYSLPLLDFMASLPPEDKVVLVGHSWGGLNAAYATELFSNKVLLAVYIAAPMLPRKGSSQPPENCVSVYGNGPSKPATGFMSRIDLARQLAYQLTSAEDFLLVSTLQRPIPLAALDARFAVTGECYGSVPRVFIKTLQDRVYTPQRQDADIASNPFPNLKQVLSIDSDHVAPMSRASQLHKIFVSLVDSHLSGYV